MHVDMHIETHTSVPSCARTLSPRPHLEVNCYATERAEGTNSDAKIDAKTDADQFQGGEDAGSRMKPSASDSMPSVAEVEQGLRCTIKAKPPKPSKGSG